MNKEDLRLGNVVVTRNGHTYVYNYYVTDGKWVEKLVPLDNRENISFNSYNEDLTYNTDNKEYNQYDIMKVYNDYTLKELLWERKEKPKLTDDEKAILRNIDKDYKWIARDESTHLYIFINKPSKRECIWNSAEGDLTSLHIFNHLFQSIKWEDEEPYLIEDLLKGEK